jgi:predicted ferric reductase
VPAEGGITQSSYMLVGSAHVDRNPRATWFFLYTLAITGPLVLARLGGWHGGRSLPAELGSSLGIVALSLLAMQLVLPSRVRLLSSLGADVAVRLHRRATDVTLSLIAAHVVVVMFAAPHRLRLLAFFGAPWRAQAAIGSVAALAALVHSSLRRRRMGMHYNGWRAVHAWLGAMAFGLAVVHTVGVHRYLCTGVGWIGLAALTTAAIGSLVSLRVVRQRQVSRRPYVVDGVVAERGGATTVHLAATGHPGQRFAPGQFAWLKFADRPYRWTEHPFSYSSSAERPHRPSFTIKHRGSFAARAAGLERGMHLLVDGPHGAFRHDPLSAGTAMFAGGIGITPCMSILHTARDRGDRRPYALFYASRTYDEITFREDLDELAAGLDLAVVHVLSRPGVGWAGERGPIDAPTIERHLPDDVRRWRFFACGPPAMVEAVIQALDRLGVPAERIDAERFVRV